MLDDDLLDLDSALMVGRVTSVEGRRVKVGVDKLKNASHTLYQGALLRNAAVGGFVKIAKGYASLIAQVDGESVHEDRLAQRTSYGRAVDRVARTLEVSLVGYLEDGRFRRGVREMPLLDNECFVLTSDELRAIHQFAPPGVDTFRIGVLATEPTQPVELGVDAIFASHIGIFGNTGSGKSYTLAKLYHEVFARFGKRPGFKDRARVVLVDFNGEYVDRQKTSGEDGDRSTAIIVGNDSKRTYRLSTGKQAGDRLPFAAEALEDPTFWQVLLEATEKTQAPFISRVLRSKRWDRLDRNAGSVMEHVAQVVLRATTTSELTVDRQTSVRLLADVQKVLGDASPRLQQVIHRVETCLGFHSGDNRTYYWAEAGSKTYSNNADWWKQHIHSVVADAAVDAGPIDDVDLIHLKLVLQYYEDVVSGFANPEHIGPLIKRLHERVPDIKKVVRLSDDRLADAPLTVVSLNDVKLAMRKVIPLLVCKTLYDEKKRDDPTRTTYLNLVIDEAHNILSAQSTRESDVWRDYRLETFEEIVKEGRKFGVFLTIASQRPHDISETIVSQLHNYFLHRLVNNLDVRSIERAVAYLDAVSFESIPILATGTCIVAGVSAQVPVVANVGALPRSAEPNSPTMSVAAAWG